MSENKVTVSEQRSTSDEDSFSPVIKRRRLKRMSEEPKITKKQKVSQNNEFRISKHD
jgi:hypothetical protein